MKTLLIPAFAAVLILAACNNNATDKEADVHDVQQVEKPTTANAQPYTVDTNASTVKWEGHKSLDIGKAHHGTVKIQSGTVYVQNDTLAGGDFVLNMRTIDNVDRKEANDMENYNKLVGHLKSADFFDVEKYPTAKFEITSIEPLKGGGDNNFTVAGNLTLKQKTANISFPAKITAKPGQLNAKAKFVIDRSKFDVRYGSETYLPDLAKDKVISNDITMDIDIVAKKQ